MDLHSTGGAVSIITPRYNQGRPAANDPVPKCETITRTRDWCRERRRSCSAARKQRPRVKRVTARQRHNRLRSTIMFRPVDEQESHGSTQASQPFAAGLRSDPPAPCLLSLGVTAPEGPQDAALDSSSPADLQFGHLAVSLAKLLETAKRELERDREAAKASLVTASSILHSEIERRSRARGARPGALAAWQIARVRAFIDENLHRTIHAKDLSAVAQRSTAHFSRSFKQALFAADLGRRSLRGLPKSR